MKLSKFTALLPLPLLAACGQTQDSGSEKDQTNAEKPNFIVILADDMGYSDIGCFGSEIETPNLDRMAEQGLRMTQFYNASRSCPTRASLLTGLYQHQAGVGDMVHNLGFPSYQGFLNDSCMTIAEVLRHNGYKTYMSGKWHVGDEAPNWPIKRGFDRYFGLINGASSYFNLKGYRKNRQDKVMLTDDERYYPPDSNFYMTDAFTQHACKYIRANQNQEKPFFLYLAYTAPHWPLHALPEDIDKYRGKYDMGWDSLRARRYERMLKMGIIKEQWNLSPRYDKNPAWNSLSAKEKQDWSLRMAVYAAMIDRMDQGIGKVLEALEETGQDKNTLVVFLSDNGGCHEDPNRWSNIVYPRHGEIGTRNSFAGYDYRWANASNTPFRMFKHWVHEGGISTPFVAWFPGQIEPNTISHQPAHIIDIMPTLLDFAGGKYPERFKGIPIIPMQGESLRPVFEGKNPDKERTLFWEHEGNRAIRKGDWKLVSKYPENQWELYNLQTDRVELNDLAAENPEKAQQLQQEWDKWSRYAKVVDRDTLVKIRKRQKEQRRKELENAKK